MTTGRADYRHVSVLPAAPQVAASPAENEGGDGTGQWRGLPVIARYCQHDGYGTEQRQQQRDHACSGHAVVFYACAILSCHSAA